MERAELLSAIEAGWKRWQEILERLTPEQMVEPALPGGWSVKDTISHIALYEDWVAEFIRTRAWPTPRHPSLDTWDMDARNNAWFELSKDLPLDQVLAESHRAHRDLVDAVAALTDEEYHDKHLLGQPPDQDWSIEKLVAGNSCEHYPEHVEAVESWLASTR